MTEAEFLQVAMKMTELRLNGPYQDAERMRQKSSAEQMASADPKSDAHAAIRLLIGTWDRIAIFSHSFNDQELKRFFRCTPVWLVWHTLEPGVRIIRASGRVGPRYGKELEDLAKVYYDWTQTPAGQEYRTAEEQAVCANFA